MATILDENGDEEEEEEEEEARRASQKDRGVTESRIGSTRVKISSKASQHSRS